MTHAEAIRAFRKKIKSLPQGRSYLFTFEEWPTLILPNITTWMRRSNALRNYALQHCYRISCRKHPAGIIVTRL